MSTATKDRRSPLAELVEAMPFEPLEDTPTNLAPETPLTREAVIHLRAAAMEIDGPMATVRAILGTVKEALAAATPTGDKVFSEDRRLDLARLLSEAEKMSMDAVCAVFERGRGERPHGGMESEPPPGRLHRLRYDLEDARDNLEGESPDVDLALEYVVEALDRVEEATRAHLPGSHAEYEAGGFSEEDGLFYGHARCWCCGAVEKLDGVDEAPRLGPDKKSRRVSFRGFEGTYLDACCSVCGSRLVAMDDGELAPVFGDRW